MVHLPNGVDIHNLINDLRNFSWEAADTLLYYGEKLKDSKHNSNIIKSKDNQDPVTLADLKVNEIIIQRINEKYKNINWEILSEENVKKDSQNCEINSKWLWVLDPLDGTKDFIQGTGNYAMHLGLNKEQKSYLGLVLIPEKNELWISDSEKTWCEGRNKFKLEYNFYPKKTLEEMIIVTSKNHQNKTLKKLIEKANFKEVVVMGSIGCKIASILRGESDIYLSLSLPGESCPKDWDFAAPAAILKAAGGAITDIDNKELTYGSSNFEQRGIIIASNNKKKHKNICLKVKELLKINNINIFS